LSDKDDELEERRDEARRDKGRISFDCFRLRYKNNRAVCSMGHTLGIAKDGSMSMVKIMGGMLCASCKDCEDWDG